MITLFILFGWFQKIYKDVKSLPTFYYRLASKRSVTVRQLRQLEKHYLKWSKYQLDLAYFTRCYEMDMCPKFLRFKAPKLNAYKEVQKVLKQVVLNRAQLVPKVFASPTAFLPGRPSSFVIEKYRS